MEPDARAGFLDFESTREIILPKNPLEMIIGQDEVVKIARVVARQRRHLLLVGPPGTGKSMLAQAIAFILPQPTQEVSVLHNPENPERPVIEVRDREKIVKDRKPKEFEGKMLSASEVPSFVAERLGFRCKRCGNLSNFNTPVCPKCGADKYRRELSPFDDLIFGFMGEVREDRVHTTRAFPDGREEVVLYERDEEGKIRIYDQSSLRKIEEIESKRPRKIILPLQRNTFIQATGASETELVGDVKHDPYGGHPEIGMAAYLRVVPGAIHEAHEGVLFIDEIATLGYLQRYLLTAMQEKKFPIAGRNASSTGASIRVDNVPCDFILIGALNTNDMDHLLPPLRSRILGNGYEVLLGTTMPDTDENRKKLVQFIAQEIRKDGRIPHANSKAVAVLLDEARARAKSIDDVVGLTLRLRDLSGIIKLAGDLAVTDGSELIDEKHVRAALKRGRSIEEQVSERYDSWWRAGMSDYGAKRRKSDESEVA